MKTAAIDCGADFVYLYAGTGSNTLHAGTGTNTACDGADQGIGRLLEDSQLELLVTKIPWYAHPNEKGRPRWSSNGRKRGRQDNVRPSARSWLCSGHHPGAVT